MGVIETSEAMSIIDGERSQVTFLTLRLIDFLHSPMSIYNFVTSLFGNGCRKCFLPPWPSLLVRNVHTSRCSDTSHQGLHVRADIIGVEIEPTAKLLFAPVGVTVILFAVGKSAKCVAVDDAVHLRYLFNRQGCCLHLRLLKKPRTRH